MRKKDILPLLTMWIELECIKLSEISQTQKYKHYMLKLIIVI